MVSICRKEKLPWWRAVAILFSAGIKTSLECSKELYWSSKMALTGYFLRSKASLALGTCLGFYYQAWFPSYWIIHKSNETAVIYHQYASAIFYTFIIKLSCQCCPLLWLTVLQLGRAITWFPLLASYVAFSSTIKATKQEGRFHVGGTNNTQVIKLFDFYLKHIYLYINIFVYIIHKYIYIYVYNTHIMLHGLTMSLTRTTHYLIGTGIKNTM